MQYRTIGKTKEKVSALGFGCMRLPLLEEGKPSKIDEKLAIAMVHQAIEQGVNYFDTAYPYHGTGMAHGGESEPFLAKALQGGLRQKVKIATKLPSWLIHTREDMDRYLDEQLQRLQTDHIDFYLIHSVERTTWPILKVAGVDDFLNHALSDGRILHAGFSFHDKLEIFKEVVDFYDWSFCQIQYNYMDEEFQAGTEGLRYAAAKGLGIVVMEPLRGGKLAVVPDDIRQVFDRSPIQRTPAEWGLRWVWNHPEVSVALSGMSTMAQLTENIALAGTSQAGALSAQELGWIEEAKRLFASKIKVPCTGCEYCMPCPQKVNIPKNFSCFNDYYVYGKSDTYAWVPQFQRASNCIECHECESHCPQGIAISEEMKKVVALFE